MVLQCSSFFLIQPSSLTRRPHAGGTQNERRTHAERIKRRTQPERIKRRVACFCLHERMWQGALA